MKTWIILFATILSFTTLSAQQETLFKHVRVRGAFGAPISEIGLNNNLNTSFGFGGGLVLNSMFIGAYGLASTDVDDWLEEGDLEVLDIGHGGLWIGGGFKPYKLLHVYGSARLGWGAVNIRLNDNVEYEDVDKIFAATPEIGMELNITRWLRLAGTVGYRFVSGTRESNGYTDEDFSGAIAGITLRIGGFGSNRYANW